MKSSTPLLSKFDSVFSQFAKDDNSPLDKLENEFVQRMITLVQAESNSLIKSLRGATSEEDIDKAKWNLIPRMQQLLWYLWRDGWALGKDTAVRELALAKFTTNNELAEFASDSDSTGSRRSLRNKTRISSIKTPLEDSRVKKAIEDRTLELSNDYSESTNKEIKDAFREFNNSKDKKDARAKLEERIARAIGANNEQSNKRVRDTAARAKVIARTELTGAYNTARVDSFAAAGVKRFLWVANIVPGRTCNPCLERNGVIYTLEEIRTNFPPLHPHCRCTLKPLQEDDDRVKNQKKGIKDAIAPIAAGWLFGKAAEKVSAAAMAEIDKIPDKEEKKNDIGTKLFIGISAALGLAGIYYLVTRNPTVKQATQRATKETVEELGDQVEAYRQRKQAQEGLTEDKQPSALGQGAVTAASLPPSVQQNLPSELVNSNADIRNISPQEISRLTGMSIRDATRLRLQLDEELAKNPVKPEKTVDKMNNKQLKALGLTNKQINQLRRMKRQGQSFATIDDLKKIKGVSDRKIQEIKRRVEEERDPSLVLGGKKIEELSTKELKEYLRLSQNQAVAVREYLRKNRITKIEDLRNVPGIGKETVARAAYGVMRTTPRANINNFGNEGGVSNVNLLSERTGISRNLAQIIADERQQNGNFADMDDFRKRVNKRLKDSGSKVRLGKSVIKKINDNVTFLPSGEEEKPLIIPPKINPSKPLPQKQTRMGDPRTPQVEPERMVAPSPQKKVLPGSTRIKGRRVSPEERVNAAKLEDERQYRELAKEVEAYHLIPGTKGKIRGQVKRRISENTAIARQQENAYVAANSSANRATRVIDSLEEDVKALEDAYRSGNTEKIGDAKEAYLNQIKRVESRLDEITVPSSDDIDAAIEQTKVARSAAERSIASNAQRNTRRKAIEARMKASRADTSELENELQRNYTLERIDDQIDSLDRLSASLQNDPNNVRATIQRNKARLQELKERVANASALETPTVKPQPQPSRFTLLQQEINDIERQIPFAESKLNVTNREKEKNVNRLAGIEIRIRSNDAGPNAEVLKKEKAKLEREISRLTAQARSLSSELRGLKSQLSTLKKRRKSNKDNRGFSRGGKLAMFVSNLRNGI
jgi:SPP1 gp7 family putative phage head morphogenesis protein